MLQLKFIPVDCLDASEPYHLLNSLQFFQLCLADSGAMEHGWPYRGVQTKEVAAAFQPVEHIVNGVGLGDGLELAGQRTNRTFKKINTGLRVCPVQHPAISRHDPGDGIRVNAVFQKPQAGIHAGLATAEDYICRCRHCLAGQSVDRNQLHTGSN